MRINNYTTKITKVTLAMLAFTSLQGTAQTHNNDRVHLGILYPISTHGTDAPLDTNDFSLHLLGGVSAEERGLAFAGFANIVRNNIRGVAFAGFSNHINKKADGMLFAGFANTYGEGRGMQFAGFSNVASDDVEGAQFAGFLNKADNVMGTQIAGFSNHSREVSGSQFAGFSNTAKAVGGSQFAGFSNVTSGEVKGSQLSGFINVAKEISGSQVAGFINVAKKVKGAQIAGFINVADSSDHPIGIINIIKNGEKSIGFSVDENQTSLLTFRSGGKVLYGILGAGYNFENEDHVYAMEAGLGAHFFRTKVFRLNTEASFQMLENFEAGDYFKSSLKLMPSVRLAKKLELYGGPSFSYINTNTTEGKAMISDYIWEHQNRWGKDFHATYIGYQAGINFIF